jgi:hypothetical protein
VAAALYPSAKGLVERFLGRPCGLLWIHFLFRSWSFSSTRSSKYTCIGLTSLPCKQNQKPRVSSVAAYGHSNTGSAGSDPTEAWIFAVVVECRQRPCDWLISHTWHSTEAATNVIKLKAAHS